MIGQRFGIGNIAFDVNFPKYKQQLKLILCSCLANCHCHTTFLYLSTLKTAKMIRLIPDQNLIEKQKYWGYAWYYYDYLSPYTIGVHPSRLFPKHCTCKLLLSRQPPTPKSLTKSQLWSAKNYNKLSIIYTVLPKFKRSAHVVSLEMSIHPARLIQIKMDILPLEI